jgi:hypothetical protein
MSFAQTRLPVLPAPEEGRDLRARRSDCESDTDAAMRELAQMMGKIAELVRHHPEWQRQQPAKQMSNILAALRRL